MATALTVGGWFASAIIDALIDKIISGAIQQFGLQSGLKNNLRKLSISLYKARAVLRSAEKRRSSVDGDLDELMKLLHDAARDAEDLLDEIQYEQLSREVEGTDDQAGGFLSSFSFAEDFFRTWFDDTVSKMGEIQERLDIITADLGEMVQLYTEVGVPLVVGRENSSFLAEPVVLGRDKQRDQLIGLLFKTGSGGGSTSTTSGSTSCSCSNLSVSVSVSVVGIIGAGGMGKTTLAQFVYNDPRVQAHFELKIWITVSDQLLDVKRLVKEMLDSVSSDGGGSHHGLSNLNALQVALRDKIMGKKFLLVLDDVWNEDRSLWDRFCSVLMFGAEGSKVLLTTRSKMVARTTNAEDEINIGGLSDDDCWFLFRRCAFGSRSGYPRLEAMGKKTADKLKGSPLAAKVLGGLLNNNLDENHWRSILESEISELQGGDNDIMRILGLSYHHLPAPLKQCFAYCSLFPKDHLFKEDELVRFWIAQGYITPQGSLRMEDIGRGYLHDLTCRSFFQRIPWRKPRYVMHDLIHDLAMSVSMDGYLRIEDGDKYNSHKITGGVCHLSVYAEDVNPTEILELCQHNKLRSLVIPLLIYSKLNIGSVLDELFEASTSIRVLVIRYCGLTYLPESIGNLKHLRYLDISHNNISRLPESLGTLYNLQFLKTKQKCSIQYYPVGITNLVNLRLWKDDNQNEWAVSGDGCGLERLTCLQILRQFRVREDAKNIKVLKDFQDLRILCIQNTENIKSKEQASNAQLIKKKYLESLCVEWDNNQSGDGKSGNDDVRHHLEALEGLQPNPNLRELSLRGYKGVEYPSWMSSSYLSNLKSLNLCDCNSLAQLPACIDQLPFLNDMEITTMRGAKQQPPGFASSSLIKLVFYDIPEWEEWSVGAANVQCAFPQLRILRIYGCPKLRSMPPVPSSLLTLELQRVGLSEIRCCLRVDSALEVLYIDDCEELVSLPTGWFKQLSSLCKLKIIKCPKLDGTTQQISFPVSLGILTFSHNLFVGCLQNLPRLRMLKMKACSRIISLELGNLRAIEDLMITDCAELTTWIKLSQIHHIFVDYGLPQAQSITSTSA